jgi:hypothetical protein
LPAAVPVSIGCSVAFRAAPRARTVRTITEVEALGRHDYPLPGPGHHENINQNSKLDAGAH